MGASSVRARREPGPPASAAQWAGPRPVTLVPLTARVRWKEYLSAGEKLRPVMRGTRGGLRWAFGSARPRRRDLHFRCLPGLLVFEGPWGSPVCAFGPCGVPRGTGFLARGDGAGSTLSPSHTPTRHTSRSRWGPLVLLFLVHFGKHIQAPPGLKSSEHQVWSLWGGPRVKWALWGDHGWLSAVTSSAP